MIDIIEQAQNSILNKVADSYCKNEQIRSEILESVKLILKLEQLKQDFTSKTKKE